MNVEDYNNRQSLIRDIRECGSTVQFHLLTGICELLVAKGVVDKDELLEMTDGKLEHMEKIVPETFEDSEDEQLALELYQKAMRMSFELFRTKIEQI